MCRGRLRQARSNKKSSKRKGSKKKLLGMNHQRREVLRAEERGRREQRVRDAIAAVVPEALRGSDWSPKSVLDALFSKPILGRRSR